MLFIQPAVVPADDAVAAVAEVQKMTKATPSRALPAWPGSVELAQLDSGRSNASQNQAAPGTSIGGTPPISNPSNGTSAVPPNPVGAAPPIPGDTSSPTGNTYGGQQERSGGANGVTAPVTPGVPGPGAGTGGGSGMAAPEMATPPAGNMDSGSSYKNLSSPYNSSGNGAGLTGTGMSTTAAPPSAGTTATPGTTPVTPPPSTSGASGTR